MLVLAIFILWLTADLDVHLKRDNFCMPICLNTSRQKTWTYKSTIANFLGHKKEIIIIVAALQ